MTNIFLLLLGLVWAQNTTVDTIRLRESGGTNSIVVKAPSSFSTNYNFTLPIIAGTAGQALTTDGSGTTSWADFLGASTPATLANKTLTAPIMNFGTIASAYFNLGTINYSFLNAVNITNSTTGVGMVLNQPTVNGGTTTGGTLNSAMYSLGTASGLTLSNGTIHHAILKGDLYMGAGTIYGGFISSNITGILKPDSEVETTLAFNEQGSTPASPAPGQRKVYATNSGFVQLDSNGTVSPLGGGADATNLLLNSSFELGTIGFSLPNGTAAMDTSDFVHGKQSARFPISSVNGTIASQVYTGGGNFVGLNFESAMYAKSLLASGGTAQVCATVNGVDSSCRTVINDNQWRLYPVNFVVPSGGTPGVSLKTISSSSGTLWSDNTYTGTARNLNQINSSRGDMGSATTVGATNCVWIRSGTLGTALGPFPADNDCNSPVLKGTALAPSTKIPGIRFRSIPAGKLSCRASGLFMKDASTVDPVSFAFYDGTTLTPGQSVYIVSNNGGTPTIFGDFYYDQAQGERTIQVYGAALGSSESVNISANSNGKIDFNITCEHFSTANELAVSQKVPSAPTVKTFSAAGACTWNRPDGVTHIRIRAVGAGSGGGGGSNNGANAGTSGSGASDTTFGSYITAGGGQATGSGDGSGSGGSGGTAVINSPAYGTVMPGTRGGPSQRGSTDPVYIAGGFGGSSCFGGGGAPGGVNTGGFNATGYGSGGGGGGNAANSTGNTGPGGGSGGCVDAWLSNPPSTVSCNVGTKGGGGAASGGGGNGASGADGYLEITEYYGGQAPILVGGLTTSSKGADNVDRSLITCSSSSFINDQGGDWISSIGNRSGSKCIVTLKTGLFRSNPNCWGNMASNGTTAMLSPHFNVLSATSVEVYPFSQSSGTTTSVDSAIHFFCMGPRN